jgi:hypothetical protein
MGYEYLTFSLLYRRLRCVCPSYVGNASLTTNQIETRVACEYCDMVSMSFSDYECQVYPLIKTASYGSFYEIQSLIVSLFVCYGRYSLIIYRGSFIGLTMICVVTCDVYGCIVLPGRTNNDFHRGYSTEGKRRSHKSLSL